MEMTEADIMVEAITTIILYLFKLIPKDFASSSFNESMLSLHLNKKIITIPNIIGGVPKIKFL